jgi:phosphatidylglycerophosphate synthase
MALVLYLALEITRFKPSGLSKVNTAVQIGGLILVLLSRTQPGFDVVATITLYAVAVLTISSGLDYIFRANRMVADQNGGTS